MKTLASLLLISASLAGTAAYAQGSTGELDYPPAFSQSSSLSRAQVVAELQAARAAGQVTYGEVEAPRAAASTLTREQVRAEAAREQGPVAFGGKGYPNTGA